MRLLQSLVPALALLASSGAIAQTAYPDRPIRMIVPLAAASAVRRLRQMAKLRSRHFHPARRVAPEA